MGMSVEGVVLSIGKGFTQLLDLVFYVHTQLLCTHMICVDIDKMKSCVYTPCVDIDTSPPVRQFPHMACVHNLCGY